MEVAIAMQCQSKQRIYLCDLEQKLGNLSSFDESCEILQFLLNGPFSATEEGEFYEIKGRVTEIKGIKLSINSNEHPPPHFHFSYGNEKGSFTIADCILIVGNLSRRTRNIIYGWWEYNKKFLIQKWNDSRPTDCSVGVYKE